jgi:hypothetical protein
MFFVVLVESESGLDRVDSFSTVLLPEALHKCQIGTINRTIILVIKILEQLGVLLLAVRLQKIARKRLVVDNPEKLSQLQLALQMQNHMVHYQIRRKQEQ